MVTFSTFAQVNGTISYQGYLTDDAGEPVNDGATHSFVFKFYDSGSSEVLSRTVTSEVDKGLFSVIIGGGTGDNSPLPTDIWNEDYTIGISVDGGAELTPRTPLTTVPYSFQAETANSVAGSNISGTVSGSQIGTGLDGANITDATIPTAKINGTIAIADGGTNATTEADARNNLGLVIGTNVQAYDADLDDLADGSLTGSKVGTGISGANITDGTIPTAKISGTVAIADGGTNATTEANARTNLGLAIGINVQAYDADLADLADGTLSNTVLDADLQDLADGELSGSKVGSGIAGANIDNASIASSKISGPILVPKGGTGASTLTGILIGNGLTAFTAVAAGGGTQYLRSNAGNTAYEFGSVSVSASNITTGTLPNTVLDADLQDLADGSLTGSLVDPDFGAQDVTTTEGLHVGGTSSPGTDNLDIDGFTQLGTSSISVSAGTVSHPAIKVLLIEGTTASTPGATSSTTVTGMTASAVISVQVLVEYDTDDYMHAGFTAFAGYEFNFDYQNNILEIRTTLANSSSILSAPFKATITYTE